MLQRHQDRGPLPASPGEEAGEQPPGTAVEVASRLLHRTLLPLRDHGLPVDGARDAARSIGGRGPVGIDAGDERAVQAACGIMLVHGRATGGPRPLTADYVSAVTGVLAAQGATACLVARLRGQGGLRSGTSLAQGALLALTQYLAAATAPGAVSGAVHGVGLAALTTADEVSVEIETLDPLAWAGFWQELGVDPRTTGRGWGPFQSRFGTAVCPLPRELRTALRRTPLRAVRATAARHGVALAEIGATTTAPVLDAWTLAPADTPRPGPAAPRGHRRETSGGPAPLSGLRVVESTRRVQGPMAGHVLRLLGAEVVRVEPPGGDPMRWLAPMAGDCSARFSALNTGKSVVEADLSTPRGQAAVRELVSGADVFLHTWAPGKAEGYGLDADDLRSVRPGLVYASASGFGGALGPRPPIGTDYLAQVHGGLAAALRPADEPPAPSLMTVTDVLGGLVLAQAALAGLALREGTGHGCRADSSLLSAAALVPRPARRTVLSALDAPLATADGLLHLGARARAHPAAVAAAVGAPDPSAVPDRLREGSTAGWLDALREAGLPSVPVRTDLAATAGDPAFAKAVLPPDAEARHARPASPWDFARGDR
ncbi:CoA transferase [Streptomyces sp. SID8352]|uniref:CoA transferase n=1 Tax=Streptomyces sp. SID8352 TaxID=2690338 RepID=UPI001367D009|nr:CoA transferase [Streptomyces sp. SID8352]MYU20751.1 CoA transferase [Streptomyces sp. SID8352]